MGSLTKLSPLTERFIVELLLTMSDIGYCLTRGDIKDVVAKYLANTGQSDLFTGGRPTDNWYYRFIK